MSFEGISDEYLESVRQEHEAFLSQLESYAVVGIATGDWNSFYQLLVEYQSKYDLHHVAGIAIREEKYAD